MPKSRKKISLHANRNLASVGHAGKRHLLQFRMNSFPLSLISIESRRRIIYLLQAIVASHVPWWKNNEGATKTKPHNHGAEVDPAQCARPTLGNVKVSASRHRLAASGSVYDLFQTNLKSWSTSSAVLRVQCKRGLGHSNWYGVKSRQSGNQKP